MPVDITGLMGEPVFRYTKDDDKTAPSMEDSLLEDYGKDLDGSTQFFMRFKTPLDLFRPKTKSSTLIYWCCLSQIGGATEKERRSSGAAEQRSGDPPHPATDQLWLCNVAWP